MGLVKTSCTGLFGSFILALILFTIGFSSPYWIKDHLLGADYYAGLWRKCSTVTGEKECEKVDFSVMPGWFDATVGLMISALILAVFGGCVSFLVPLAALLQFLAGSCGLSGVIVYAVEREEGTLSWAYWLSLTGSTLLFLNGVGLAVFAVKMRCSMEPQLPCKSDSDVV